MNFSVGKQILSLKEKEAEPRLPPLQKQLVNVAKAATRTVTQAARGKPLLVESDEAKARFAICEQCDFFRPSDERCAHSACACFLRAKTWLKSEKCPAQKW